jgi:hypothetical protein
VSLALKYLTRRGMLFSNHLELLTLIICLVVETDAQIWDYMSGLENSNTC